MRGYGNDSRQTRPFGMPVSGSVSETALISNLPNSVRRTGVPYLETLAKRVASEQLHRINDLRRCGPFCRESLPYPYSSLTKAKLPLSRSTGRSTLRSCPPDFSIRRCR